MSTMTKGIDESTRTNAFGNDKDEYGYEPHLGSYRKLAPKKNQLEDPDREVKSSFTFSVTEWYHDETGQLKQRTIRF